MKKLSRFNIYRRRESILIFLRRRRSLRFILLTYDKKKIPLTSSSNFQLFPPFFLTKREMNKREGNDQEEWKRDME
jgi:hypothetical protein